MMAYKMNKMYFFFQLSCNVLPLDIYNKETNKYFLVLSVVTKENIYFLYLEIQFYYYRPMSKQSKS